MIKLQFMKDKRIFYGILFTITVTIAIIIFALYNEGVFLNKTYHNQLLDYDITIPRGYRLGIEYMAFLATLDDRPLRINTNTYFDPNTAELVVLTRQSKSQEKTNVSRLDSRRVTSLEQVCDCIVLSPIFKPQQITEMIDDKELTKGLKTKAGEITYANGKTTNIYHWKLATIAVNDTTQAATPIKAVRAVSDIYFREPRSFAFDNEYTINYQLDVYGLQLTSFVQNNNSSPFQKIARAITF